MILCESVLMTILTMLGAFAIYTDFKSGIIRNKAVLLAGLTGVGVDCIYYMFYCQDIFVRFLINLAVIAMLSVAFYGFHFWAAGDSKLLICVTLLFPARLYGLKPTTIAPGINAIVYTFLIAYAYIFVESLYRCIKKEKFYSRGINKSTIKVFVASYAVGFLYMRGLNEVFRMVLRQIYYENQLLFSFVGIFLALFIHEHVFFRKWYMLLLMLAYNLLMIQKVQLT